jgi:hypothetical protein
MLASLPNDRPFMTTPSRNPANSPPGTAPARGRRLPDWAALLFLGAVFASLAAWSWRKWPDIQIDYAQQLYFPWQIASGKIMFRDMRYLSGGPLTQYFHGLVFKLFGASFTTIVITSLVLLAVMIVVLYRLFLRCSDQLTAVMACLVTLCVFSFSQLTSVAIFNYICPYAYEAFHGLLLSVAAIACLWQWIISRHQRWMLLAGPCLGGVFLGKPEIFGAVVLAFVAGVFAEWKACPAAPGFRRCGWLLLSLGFAFPLAAFLIYYAAVWDITDGLLAIAGSWVPMLTTHVPKNAFHVWEMGFEHPVENLDVMFRRFGGFLVGVGCIALVSRNYRRANAPIRTALAFLICAFWWWSTTRFRWSRCGNALGPITVLGFIFICWKWWRSRSSDAGLPLMLPLIWSAFAVGMLPRMGLLPRLWHYGFFLGMPAALFAVYLIFTLLPAELARFRVNPQIFRAVAAAFVVTALGQMIWESNLYYRVKTFSVGDGPNEILAPDPRLDSRSLAFEEAVSWIQTNTAPSCTIAALPEGTLINFLTRRPNPTPYLDLGPSEMEAFGETNVTAAYERARPDYIVLVHRETADWKVGYFGSSTGYGHELMEWIRAEYDPVWGIGPEPLLTNRFGIRILKRRDLQLPP